MLNLYYCSKGHEIADKKKNKMIADTMKLTIKENGYVEIFSSILNEEVGKVKNSEAIIPGWGGIAIEADDEIEPRAFKHGCKVQKIEFGKIVDRKHENQELDAIYQIII